MHQLSSAQTDAKRWSTTSEPDDVTIRTGAVTAMRKAHFEGGEIFAIAEEQALLSSLCHPSSIQRRELIQTNIPDRTHLVREAARMLWVSLTWHLSFATPPYPLAERLDDSSWTSKLCGIDEAYLPDGEAIALAVGAGLSSVSVHFFQFLAEALRVLQSHPTPSVNQADDDIHLLDILDGWNDIAQTHLLRMRELAGESRCMLHNFALVIYHWTRIRLLRPHLYRLQKHSFAGMQALVASCREALLSIQRILAISDVDLSIFSPLITLVKVDATLLLALHLHYLAQSNYTNCSAEYNEARRLAKTSLLLMWTHAAEAAPNRLGKIPPWTKGMRQLVEEILLDAFERKAVTLRDGPRIKIEDGEVASTELDQNDKLDAHLGGVGEGTALQVYKNILLGDDDHLRRTPLFFDALDGFLRSL